MQPTSDLGLSLQMATASPASPVHFLSFPFLFKEKIYHFKSKEFLFFDSSPSYERITLL